MPETIQETAMRMELTIAAMLLTAGLAHAELRGAVEPPRFTPTETRLIARNDILVSIVEADPWLVRKILDDLVQKGGAPRPGKISIDAKKNPDLVGQPRSAESTVEWLDMVARAKQVKEQRERETHRKPETSSRSAEGTVEMLELMRKARDQKGGQTGQAAPGAR
jgi:hypothetical protein